MNDFGRRTNKSHGYVSWSQTGWESTGEGGMSAYAVWWAVPNEVCIPYVSALFQATIMEDLKLDQKVKLIINGKIMPGVEEYASVAGLLYLGSTGLSLWNGHQYFEATRDDLTHSGKTLIGELDKHYGLESEIVTCLDT